MLSSVGRVATRDSSKDAAGTYDLFVALCEDDAIYPIFKGSKGAFRHFLRVPRLNRRLQYMMPLKVP